MVVRYHRVACTSIWNAQHLQDALIVECVYIARIQEMRRPSTTTLTSHQSHIIVHLTRDGGVGGGSAECTREWANNIRELIQHESATMDLCRFGTESYLLRSFWLRLRLWLLGLCFFCHLSYLIRVRVRCTRLPLVEPIKCLCQ